MVKVMEEEMDYKYEESFDEWVNFVASEKVVEEREERRERRREMTKRVMKGLILWVSFFVVLIFISIFDSILESSIVLGMSSFVGIVFIIIFNVWLVGDVGEAERLMCVRFFDRLCGFKGDEHDTRI